MVKKEYMYGNKCETDWSLSRRVFKLLHHTVSILEKIIIHCKNMTLSGIAIVTSLTLPILYTRGPTYISYYLKFYSSKKTDTTMVSLECMYVLCTNHDQLNLKFDTELSCSSK